MLCKHTGFFLWIICLRSKRSKSNSSVPWNSSVINKICWQILWYLQGQRQQVWISPKTDFVKVLSDKEGILLPVVTHSQGFKNRQRTKQLPEDRLVILWEWFLAICKSKFYFLFSWLIHRDVHHSFQHHLCSMQSCHPMDIDKSWLNRNEELWVQTAGKEVGRNHMVSKILWTTCTGIIACQSLWFGSAKTIVQEQMLNTPINYFSLFEIHENIVSRKEWTWSPHRKEHAGLVL